MKRRKPFISIIALSLLLASLLSSCAAAPKKTALRAIIIPKFEIGKITGDTPGEAQLFYEQYCTGCEEAEIPHLPETAHCYVNEKTGAAILVTDSGKTKAGLSLMALLSCDRYDCSNAYIVSVGCGGGSLGEAILGDVVVVTAACDYDLGHHVDSREVTEPNNAVTWFPDEDYVDQAYKPLDAELSEKVYQMIKDCPLQTTEMARKWMAENFPSWDRATQDPAVLKGTAVTGDDYWKGLYGHQNANYIVKYYGAPDPYAVTEMEEVAIAATAECFGMQDRIISIRVIVNMDVFWSTDTPESLWGTHGSFSFKVAEPNTETLDIFEPAMHNLFDASRIVIDAILEGSF